MLHFMHVYSPLLSASDSRLAVAPKWGDRIAIGDLQNDDIGWTFLSNVVSPICMCISHKYIGQLQAVAVKVHVLSYGRYGEAIVHVCCSS